MNGITTNLREVIASETLHAWVLAAIIVAATAVVSHIATKVIRRIMQVDGLPVPESSIIINVARIAIWAFGLSVMLSSCFNVDINGLVAALGVGGVALSLGLQDTLKNFIGGLQVTIMGIVRPGDHVVVGGVDGIVQDVSWRQTIVRDLDNNNHLIPNAVINSTQIQKIEPERLVVTRISFINNGRDLDELIAEMEACAKKAIEAVAPLARDPWILMTEIGEYGMWGKLRFELAEIDHAREARDAALRALAPYTRLNPEDILLAGKTAASSEKHLAELPAKGTDAQRVEVGRS